MVRASLSRYPHWEIWQGVSGLWYARRRGSSPPVVLKALTSLALADRVLDYLACPDPRLRWAMVAHDALNDDWLLDAEG